MWNPRWKCQTKQEVFHIMDACWKATAAEMVEKLGIKLPDLEKDGATGEYPPLTEPDASLPPDDARDSNNPADTRTEHSEAA